MIIRVYLGLLTPALISWVLVLRVDAQRNVTLDDDNPAIVYTPPTAWYRPGTNDLDYGGSHMLTSQPGATATFKFTGTAIYFLSPLWPYKVNVALSLDSATITVVNLVDPNQDVGSNETVKSQVVWSSLGLANKQHTLVVSVAPGQPFAIVDGLIYTEVDPTSSSATFLPSSPSLSSAYSLSSTPSLSSSPSPSTASSSTDNTGTTSKNNLSIALGSVAGILALLLIFGIVYFRHLSRRRRGIPITWTIDGSTLDGHSLISNENGSGRGHSQSQGFLGDNYPMVQPYKYLMDQSVDETWQNSQYGNITPPGMSPQHSAQQVYYPLPQNHDDQYTHGNASHLYAPEYTISSITGSSLPPSVDLQSPPLANSSSISVNMLNTELPGYHTAPGPEYSDRKQPLVVVGGAGSEDEMPDNQLSPTDEKSHSLTSHTLCA